MRIDNIHIKNFRSFKDYDVVFAEKTTVLIGKNGSGKTTLIAALKKAMSFMFAKSQEFEKSLNESNNCNVRAFNLWDTRFDDIERNFAFPTEINCSSTFNNETIQWSLLKKKDGGSLHPTLYNEALNKILSFYQKGNDITLPVLSFFSDSYPHIMSNLGDKAAKIIQMDILPRDFGYYGWDEITNCVELWQNRYIKVYNASDDLKKDIENTQEAINKLRRQINSLFPQRSEGEANLMRELEQKLNQLEYRLTKLKDSKLAANFQKERNFIDERIFTFTEPLRSDLNFINEEFQVIRISVNRPDRKSFSMEFTFSSGKSLHFEILPQGYKRLLSIIFDIAYRSYILNEDKEPQGVVFIDEIELHLHPSLQQEVLGRLRKTFPKIQFIVSTHSPLVISNLRADGKENTIIKLENRGTNYSNTVVENVYGIDYATNLKEVMDSDYRSSTIDKLMNSYLFLYGKKREEDANKILEKLKVYLGGEIPQLLQKEIDNQKQTYHLQ